MRVIGSISITLRDTFDTALAQEVSAALSTSTLTSPNGSVVTALMTRAGMAN